MKKGPFRETGKIGYTRPVLLICFLCCIFCFVLFVFVLCLVLNVTISAFKNYVLLSPVVCKSAHVLFTLVVSKAQSEMNNPETQANKRYRILKRQ
jgi:hypothetical protein